MSEILIEEYRGGILENVHRGRICVVDDKGNIVFHVGNVEQLTFFRSSSKPLQALPVIARGLDKKYGLSGAEITIMAGSHAGEKAHVEILESILKKTGLKEEDMIMNPVYPFVEDHRNELIINGLPPRKLYHNCAGKHIALMMLARELGADHRNYWRLDNSAEQEVLRYISYLAEYPAEKTGIGIDGCGVPVFAVPLHGIARSYMRFACPDTIGNSNMHAAVSRMTELIHENPYMMRGRGFLCGEINRHENIVAKGGAKGVYGFGLKKERLGIALKIEDGTEDSWPIVICGILEQLDYKEQEIFEILHKLYSSHIVNDNKTIVGEKRVAFKLCGEYL